MLAGIVGGVVGVAAYSISQTGGQRLSIVVGCLIGVAAVLGVELYRRTAHLTDVRVAVLGSEMAFRTKTDMRQAAQRMYFQAATRPLADGEGNLGAAVASLKNLFDLYREPLESEAAPLPPARSNSVYQLALDMLNVELGPFLAAWHPRLDRWVRENPGADEADWPENAAFRRDLRVLQERVRPYVVGLGKIAGIPDPASHLDRSANAPRWATPAVPAQATPRDPETRPAAPPSDGPAVGA
ncbi:hypothetical protein EBN88_24770 [Streptomyces triticirhizae]|uniref:Uncharacterized protein n=1 Tax=Streptomyces triticirhizae TaxID=2483353 RepID=A0A3M2L624_9ACTN|nr:hypothetical protein EBN88_24770 [Streptomyces triticirhizae]